MRIFKLLIDSDYVTSQLLHFPKGTKVPELSFYTVCKLLLKQKRTTSGPDELLYYSSGAPMHMILRLWLLPFLIHQSNLAFFLMNGNLSSISLTHPQRILLY